MSGPEQELCQFRERLLQALPHGLQEDWLGQTLVPAAKGPRPQEGSPAAGAVGPGSGPLLPRV